MARGLRAGDGGAHLITFHPRGNDSSSTCFHDEPWLDFNMRQNGHGVEFTGRYEKTKADYDRAADEAGARRRTGLRGSSGLIRAKTQGHSIAGDVRRAMYWDLFSGAFGHTYGHHSVWQYGTRTHAGEQPAMPWTEAINQPGAAQMQHGRALIESRPFLTRIPDDGVIVPAAVPTSVPGAGRYGSWARVTRRARTPWSTCRSAARSPCGCRRSPARRSSPGGSTRGYGSSDRNPRVRQDRNAQLHPARSGRGARLGAGHRRRVEEVPAAGKIVVTLARF